jgi:prevent-host-death family protein
MDIALNLLKAPHVGIREFKEKISSLLNKRKTLVLTDHGEPASVLIPYADMLELLDILDEINDPKTRSLVGSGRKSIKQGTKGISIFSN